MKRTLVAVAAFWPLLLHSHGGGLDANGCHTNRKTAEYHCHRDSGSSQTPPQSARTFSGQSQAERREPVASSDPFYRNCAEVRAAGAAPLRVGEPGYARHLDRDGDGIACEPYRR